MVQIAQYGGSICSGSLVESQACNTQPCAGKVTEEKHFIKLFPPFTPLLNIVIIETALSYLTVVDCQLSTWSEWVDCSVTCGGGTQLRSRLVAQAAQNGGSQCGGSLVESQICNNQSCLGKLHEERHSTSILPFTLKMQEFKLKLLKQSDDKNDL